MTNKQHYLPWVPAMGVAVAVVSLIPIVNLLNCIFCGWVLLGAAAAVKLVGDKAMASIEGGEGAIIGAMTGAIGGVLYGSVTALLQVAQISAMSGVFDQFGGNPMGGAGTGMVAFMSFFVSLILFTIFGALGGLAGSAIFKNSGPGGGMQPPQVGGPPGGLGGPLQGGGAAFGGGQGGGFGGPPQGGQGGGFGGPPQGS